MLQVRNAKESDFDRIMEIYGYARSYMALTGNPTQWGNSYPDSTIILNDIKNNICKLVYDESGVHGVFALLKEEDPTYKHIDGAWLNNESYFTIHRVAGDGKVHGIFDCALTYSKCLSNNIRIDTHRDNKIMQVLIERNGFTKCGIILTDDGTERLAYQFAGNKNA